MSNTGAWFFLFLLGLLLMISSIQGSLGRVLAVVFVPDTLLIADSLVTPTYN